MLIAPILARVRTDVTAIFADGRAAWTSEPLTQENFARHLNGGPRRGCALIPEGSDVCASAVVDIDAHNGESWDDVVAAACAIADALEDRGMPVQAFRSSGGKGMHLWMLWEQAVPARDVRAAVRSAVKDAGYTEGTGGVGKAQVEVYPRQDSVGVGKRGSLVWLPLAGESVPVTLGDNDARIGQREDAEWMPAPAWSAVPPPAPVEERSVGGSSGAGVGRPTVPWADVLAALETVENEGEASLDYDGWLRVVMAVHFEASARGCLDEGLAAVEAWSAQSHKHDEAFLRQRVWPYLKSGAEVGGEAVTGLSLIAMGGAVGAHDMDVVEDPVSEADWLRVGPEDVWVDRIRACADPEQLRQELAAGIRSDRSLQRDPVARERVVKAWRNRIGELCDVTVRITEARKQLRPQSGGAVVGARADWIQPWVYVQQEDAFVHRDSKVRLSTKAFDLTYVKEAAAAMGLDPEESLGTSATRVATAVADVKKVLRTLYMPTCGQFFRMDGGEYLNLYRPDQIVGMPDPMTAADWAAVAEWKAHLQWLLAHDEERELLLDWMCHQVRHPGKKIRWAVLLCGQEGDGKTAFSALLSAVMGHGNVRVIDSHQLESQFTAWSHGAAVGVLEEVYVPGHNRHEVVNRLKSRITNDVIEVHAKGRDPYNAPNTMNYLAFTNHEDALPQSEGGRRWLALRTRYTPAGLREALAQDPQHFERLFATLEDHAGGLRRWLYERPFSALWQPDRPAYETAFLRRMRALSVSEEAVLLEDMIDAEVPGVTDLAVSVSHLTAEVKQRRGLQLRSRAVAKALGDAGFRYAGRHRVRGERIRIWVKDGVSESDCLETLYKSLDSVEDFGHLSHK